MGIYILIFILIRLWCIVEPQDALVREVRCYMGVSMEGYLWNDIYMEGIYMELYL